ncbi:TetR/AcrR family transcriptional regulator [Paenibacillus guangzhouensis]|uniref:TetR/AcrR family transcriptional regulator n=1 Tax=Paenibacillus guangzhouensis TaxID=1473112 RepID=UPI0012677612|nr:TetR/AcrR family transcriptional regulator [Paenibacillus guangzhouensis]
MNGFERRKQKKLEQIYRVSFELFSKFGFQKVSVNEIAQLAKVSPATIYNYFGTKEQLYTDMLMNWMDKQLEQYERILDSELSFPEKTREIMLLEANNLQIISDEFSRVSELGGWVQTMESYNEQKIIQFFAKYVAMGKQEGYIHRGQTDEVTMLYFTMYKNELGRYWQEEDQEHKSRSMDQLMQLFFYGLVGKTE